MPVFLKKLLRWSLMAFAALVLVYAAGRLYVLVVDTKYEGERGPYLQMLSSGAVTIRWQGLEETHGRIQYGLHPDKLDRQAVDETVSRQHEVRLHKLRAGTTYYYRVASSVLNNSVHKLGDVHVFRTAPAPGTDSGVRFWVLGDPGYWNEKTAQVKQAALDWVSRNARNKNRTPFDFILTTGDNAYRSGSNRQYQEALFSPYAKLLSSVPVWPAYGNHDARRWVHFDLFTFPEHAESGGVASGTEHYFSFDYGPLHVVMLDSQSSDLDENAPMLTWLQKDLSFDKSRWRVVVLHHPPYTRSTHNSDDAGDSAGRMQKIRQNILPIIERAGVDLVMSGHSHTYERSYLLDCHYGRSDTLRADMILNSVRTTPVTYFKPKNTQSRAGVIYVVLGSSAKLDDGPLDHPAMARSLRQMGSLLVDINGDRLTGRFINRNGQLADEFILQKTATAPVSGRTSCPKEPNSQG